MERFDRQERIAGWEQPRFAAANIAVCGRGWLGAYTVWGLASLGVGRILWLGRPRPETAGFARWLLSDPCPVPGVRIKEYPVGGERAGEIDWVLHDSAVSAFLLAEEAPPVRTCCLAAAGKRRIPVFAGASGGGGFFGAAPARAAPAGPPDPVGSLALAGILVDAARLTLCPLPNDLLAEDGSLGLVIPSTVPQSGTIVLVGVGGIGVYAAAALAALGFRLHLEDFDTVSPSNLNRQGLFSASDAYERAFKSEAAAGLLSNLFPQARLSAGVSRVDVTFAAQLAAMRPPVSVILSAVDNARTRLDLERLGRSLGAGVPVVQGGTDTFAADVFIQEPDGPGLDEQMHGALSAAASREPGPGHPGGCAVSPSYVVPGMIAGALMAYRLLGVVSGQKRLPAARWRLGNLPVHTRSVDDVAAPAE